LGAAEAIPRVPETHPRFFGAFEAVYARMAQSRQCQFSNLNPSLSFRFSSHLACRARSSQNGRGDDVIFARVNNHGQPKRQGNHPT
jgi:hypothetical protein